MMGFMGIMGYNYFQPSRFVPLYDYYDHWNDFVPLSKHCVTAVTVQSLNNSSTASHFINSVRHFVPRYYYDSHLIIVKTRITVHTITWRALSLAES
jgi:hypothetical protein